MRRSIGLALCLWGWTFSTAFSEMNLPQGVSLYGARCAVCHGEHGDGRGPAAPSLNPKPADFRSGLYKYRSTGWTSPPLDTDLARTIRDGLNGTAMPGWRDLLSATEIDVLIQVLKSFSPKTFQAKPVPIQMPSALAQKADPTIGKKLYAEKGCTRCHGSGGRGNGPLAGQLSDAGGRKAQPWDLTDPRNYRQGATLQDIHMRVATGLQGTPMEGYASRLSAEEIQHLAAYLKSLYEAAEQIRWTAPADPPDPLRRGAYLVSVVVCQLCHTPVNPDGSYRQELRLAGGMKVTVFPDGVYYSRNLTPDRDSGLGEWTLEDIERALTRGIAKNGRQLYPYMPWPAFANLADADALAIATYLKSLPPVYNKIPPPQPNGVWTSFWNKLRLLFGREATLQYHGGNEGEPDPEKGKTLSPATRGYWSILPPLGWVPVEIVIQVAKPELPTPPSTGSATEDAKRQRGRYLVSIAPCAVCHTAIQGGLLLKTSAPLSGGMKISWGNPGGFGTVYARNLTPDPETGLGNWTDEQIKRAIQKGITKDGRMMHWQAMPWDIFSNFTEADLEAIVAYLRSLPPVRKTIPPPTLDAPSGYVVHLGKDYGAATAR